MQIYAKDSAATMGFERKFGGLESLRGVERPAAGWLRAMREAGGVSAGELGRRLGVSRQLPLQFEHAEAADSITLKSLRAVAAALGCELVYALVPRQAGLEILAESSVGAAEIAEKPLIAPAEQSRVTPREAMARSSAGDVAAPAADIASATPHFCD
jgi:predicted DNA-binding mobile mystery protein A